MHAIPPDGTDRVNNKLCRELIATSYFRLPCLAPAKQAAFTNQVRTCCAMNCAINPAAAK